LAPVDRGERRKTTTMRTTEQSKRVETMMSLAIDHIDDLYELGHAERHPQLVAGFTIALAIGEAVERFLEGQEENRKRANRNPCAQ
jgi:hypothetical protein